MAKVELPSSKSYSKKEVAVLQGPKGISDNGAASVTVYKTDDPNFELCRGCNKVCYLKKFSSPKFYAGFECSDGALYLSDYGKKGQR